MKYQSIYYRSLFFDYFLLGERAQLLTNGIENLATDKRSRQNENPKAKQGKNKARRRNEKKKKIYVAGAGNSAVTYYCCVLYRTMKYDQTRPDQSDRDRLDEARQLVVDP